MDFNKIWFQCRKYLGLVEVEVYFAKFASTPSSVMRHPPHKVYNLKVIARFLHSSGLLQGKLKMPIPKTGNQRRWCLADHFNRLLCNKNLSTVVAFCLKHTITYCSALVNIICFLFIRYMPNQKVKKNLAQNYL